MKAMSKTYTIIAGVNGTGKSSLSGVLKTERSDLGHIVDVDKIAVEENCSPIKAGRIAIDRIGEYLLKGESFTQETTLSGNKTVNTAKIAKNFGYKVRLYYVELKSLEESVKRIKNRVEKGGHDIPYETVKKRYEKKNVDLNKILPFCDEVVYYDNEIGFTERV
jgi:predicted ABC-type ATPase